jgi:hypothetical protein
VNWYDYPIGVPFGNPNYDVGLGGSHDITFQTPPNIPVTLLADGTISDISGPTWGKQVCVKLDTPVNGHAYFATFHLAATEPSLIIGKHTTKGSLLGWSGGATNSGQYGNTSNPTGNNFTNTPNMSSMLQTGIALHDGPSYGGIGWVTFPPIDETLNPMPVVDAYITWLASEPVPVDPKVSQAHLTWNATSDLLMRVYKKYADEASGIHDVWLQKYLNGINAGPPITLEQQYINWSDVAGLCQWFVSGYRIEWIDGKGIMYDAKNKEA